METLISWHRLHYPLMQAQDVVKLVFQAKLGCGHLLADEAAVTQRIVAEETALSPSFTEALTEPLGPDYVRLNLRRAMAEGIEPVWIARLMQLSCPAQLPAREEVVQAIAALDADDAMHVAQRLLTEPDWIPSHTQAYHAAYAPAYRVISTRCAEVLPALSAIAAQWDKERLLVCIDGPCGSGKTTLAKLLHQVLDAAIIPMDDFFLPHPQKTAERLAQPGGNADWERLCSEFLTPWLQEGQASYRPYDCHADAYADPVCVEPRKVTIIEGSYSLMPAISSHADLRLFLRIPPDEQQRRILQRDGERALQMFLQRWIPLEQAYFSAFQLPDERCLVFP